MNWKKWDWRWLAICFAGLIIRVHADSDVTIAKYATPEPVSTGSNITYTIIVSNGGPSTATNITMRDALPYPHVSLLSVTSQLGTCYGVGKSLTALSSNKLEDRFGNSVATDGETLFVGVPKADIIWSNEGAVYVYLRSGTNWVPQPRLTANDIETNAEFGWEMSLDGDMLVIGAPYDDDPVGGESIGSAYVFVRTGSNWSQAAKLVPSDASLYDGYGVSLALDGNTIAVGSPQNQVNLAFRGAVYVYTGTGSTWTLQQKIQLTDDHNFGNSVALDGDELAIGDFTDGPAGTVYVYARSGNTWAHQATLLPGDLTTNKYFGASLSMDGGRLLVGAYSDDQSGANVGAAYIFLRQGTNWIQTTKLMITNLAQNVHLGNCVSLCGSTAILGAPNNGDGAIYAFTMQGTGWVYVATWNGLASANDFGGAIAAYDDVIAVGDYYDERAGLGTGAAYVFDLRTRCCLDELASGQASTVTIKAKVSATADMYITNTVEVTAQTSDPDHADNVAAAQSTVAFDRDLDQIPDWWEFQYGLNPNVSNPASWDTDGDTIADINEYIANTLPTVSTDYLHFVGFSDNSGSLEFFSSSSRLYSIQRAAVLSGAWISVSGQTNFPGSNGIYVLPASIVTNKGYYRIRAKLP